MEALAAIQAAEARGVQRQIVCLPTGSSKTIILSMLALQRRVRTLILVHRDELLQQTIEKLHMVSGDPSLPIGVVKGPRDEHHQPFVVANIQTLGREKRLARVMRDFGLIIVDECHHTQGDNQYGKVLAELGAFQDGGPLTVGFTATPFRANGEPLLIDGVEGCFQEIVYTLPLPWMVEHGHLVPIEDVQLVIGDIDLSGVKVHHGDYDDEDLGRAMLAANAPAMIAKGFAPMAKGRRSIIFCPTTGIVNSMELHLKNAGIRVASVIGSTKLDVRHAIYRQLRAGELDAIVSCIPSSPPIQRVRSQLSS